jgi:hypothetical protein
MGGLRDWWEHLTGRAAASQAAPRKAPPAAAAHQATPSGGLELADEAPKTKPSRVGQAGFDPYSSDAGFAKPHSWERIDHD